MEYLDTDQKFIQAAAELSRHSILNNGGPFGCVIVHNGNIIANGWNEVTSKNDPTAHAEVVAIRNACSKIGHFELRDCTLYTSCEPCPMCLGAIYWARFKRVVYANTRDDAKNIGFDDGHIYDEIGTPHGKRKIEFMQITNDEAKKVFEEWTFKKDKIEY